MVALEIFVDVFDVARFGDGFADLLLVVLEDFIALLFAVVEREGGCFFEFVAAEDEGFIEEVGFRQEVHVNGRLTDADLRGHLFGGGSLDAAFRG